VGACGRQVANVLFITGEIQTGLCRTGRMLFCDHRRAGPEILVLGKDLRGLMLVSAVLCDNEILLNREAGTWK